MHGSSIHVLVLLAVLGLPLTKAYPWSTCWDTGNYTENSFYQANLNQLADALPKNASSSGSLFASGAISTVEGRTYAYYSANGTYQTNLAQLAAALPKYDSDAVSTIPESSFALSFCTGDINASACAACIRNAFTDAQRLCPYSKEVSILYTVCYLHFSNRNFLASTDNSGLIELYNSVNVTTGVDRYDRAITGLLSATAVYAADKSMSLFATGMMVGLDAHVPKVYSMAQCTSDLSPVQCRRCLDDLVGQWWQTFVLNTQGARSVGSRCAMRFELYPFYKVPAMLQLPADAAALLPAPAPAPVKPPLVIPGATGGKRSKGTGKILVVVLPAIAAILAAAVFGCCFWKRRRATKTPPQGQPPSAPRSEDIDNIDSFILDLSTIRIATQNFKENNKIGEGGFGVVYKGSLPDGKNIALKRLSHSSGQGIGELKNELVLVAKLQHKNLVRLLGVCLEEHEKIVIYEYMPNRSLDTILFDPVRSSLLDWGRRLKIINGIARGLQYLHEESCLKIIHRDLKASNVLLDSDYNPKISDFGLARLFGGDQSRDVTNRVVGTYGYMSPEYAMCGHYSIKSDVFSFGVLVLEIVTGKRNSGSYNSEQCVNLLSTIWEHWNMGAIAAAVDWSVSERAPGEQIVRCVHIGLLCVQENPEDRPAMPAVNVMLSSGTVSLPAPSRPAFYWKSGGGGTAEAAPVSPNEMSMTEFEPR